MKRQGVISIHTFLAEGDKGYDNIPTSSKISIHTFLAEGDQIVICTLKGRLISIHTFLAEGDTGNGKRE